MIRTSKEKHFPLLSCVVKDEYEHTKAFYSKCSSFLL